jgi:AraC-like DNA-binding protein
MEEKPGKPEKKTFHITNMNSPCCVQLLRKVFSGEGLEIGEMRQGKLEISIDPERHTWKEVEHLLQGFGFQIVRNREKILVEEIKAAMIDLVQNSTYNAMVRNSDYLVERFGMSYPYLSTLFSKHENTTLEKYTIQLRIDKVKELIRTGDLTLSEIAYMMGYSSVQYLSTQFRAVTGISVTDFKTDPFGEESAGI